ncbi:MAG: nuclear transport factor 2 family protein [Mycobacterium sp.]
MTERTIELLHRNLQEIFGEGDPARRRAAIAEVYTDDAVVYLTEGAVTGHDAIDTFAGELRATHPHFVYTPRGAAQVAQDGGILAWGSGPADQAPVYTGLDFIQTRDDKIVALYVFLNPDLG